MPNDITPVGRTPWVVPRYQGGKKLKARWIASLLPDTPAYVEPCAGMASVLLARRPARHELINDADERIVSWWRAVRDRGDELAARLAATPLSRVEFDAAEADLDSDDLVRRAAAVAIRLDQNLYGTLDGGTWRHLNCPPAHQNRPQASSSKAQHWAALADRLPALIERMRNVELDCADAIDIAARYVHTEAVTIYIDPPYANTTGYRHDLNHTALADVVRDARASVVISGYPTCPYDNLLPAWQRVDYQRRRSPHAGHGDGQVDECLWMNFDSPQQTTLL